MRTHVSLQVEVGELIRLLQLEESGKLGVGVDLAAIILVLEIISPDILVDITRHLGARHLATGRLLEELGKLIADLGGLDEARGSAVSSLALALGVQLLRTLELAHPLLLKRLILRLEGRN